MGGMVYYGKRDDTFVLKFVGDVRCTLGVCVDTFLDEVFEREEFTAVTIDLTETSGIDSTNLGLLAGISNQMQSRGQGPVVLVSTNDDITTVLESVGFDQIFDLRTTPEEAVSADQPLPLCEPTETGLAKTVLEAHQRLSELSDENRERFRSVIEAVEEQQKRS